jgi:hypothetical protein
VPRIGTRPLTVSAAWGSPFHDRPRANTAPLAARGHGATGSHVPHTEAQTKLAPPPCRTPPGQQAGTRRAHPGTLARPRFRCRLPNFDTSSAVHSRSPSWPTPDALSGAPFPATLSTPALDRRTLRWFATSPCTSGRGGPPAPRPAPPSPMQHRIQQPDPLHPGSLQRSCHTARLALKETGLCGFLISRDQDF